MVFAGSDGYKATAAVVPSAFEWRSGRVYVDPALEVFLRVYVARRKMGYRVLTLDPESRNSYGFKRAGLDGQVFGSGASRACAEFTVLGDSFTPGRRLFVGPRLQFAIEAPID